MATLNDWIEGARARTLPASIAPVLAGTGVALWMGRASLPRFILLAVVALAFQIGVNFSNDYSDGIRGTDDVRSGPPRLTGGGKTSPSVVLAAALTFYAVGCVAGLVLVIMTHQWWMIGVGVACVLAAWFYTGGKHPYGYMGLSEIFVFIFFGLVACGGTIYFQALHVPWQGWLVASAFGVIACALLMVNNTRDIPTDRINHKMTLAVRIGDTWARRTYALMLVVPLVSTLALIPTIGWRIIFFLPAAILAVVCIKPVLMHPQAQGKALIVVLRNTGFVELAYGLGALIAFWITPLAATMPVTA
ncbi:MAG: 1,4-dihydroxy-2-naphthoate polyprenyltransferase [Actinomycetaceae bacterium]|nr:1,4-dihydroxy-2-naphthoate polyprenyltransferase [Actinomycetaceae bacterium]MDY6082680.1 1,4-dihydroxy-2-naphthoate polyprenyltransferase [Actinomycetaceae bacterium]